jgi:hypothetical protein
LVAIFEGETIRELLQKNTLFGETISFSQASRRKEWEGAKPHLALILLEDEVSLLGRAQAGQAITTFDRIIRVTEAQHISPIPMQELREALPRRHQGILERTGILPKGGGGAIVRALIELRPHEVDLIRSLQRPSRIIFPRGYAGELLNQERDGLGLLLGLAGIGRQALRSWSPSPHGVPFLAGIPDRTPLEDHLIAHDVERFGSWVPGETGEVAWRSFTDGRRRVFIMNANRTAIEHTLGVDVVYWNEQESSFVLVQYKKMRKESDAPDGPSRLVYRPDGNLEAELERMRQVDAQCTQHAGNFRLLSTPCWLKLCDPSGRVGDPADLVKGMYFAREHFEEIMQTSRGPRGGTAISYQNASKHLSNTLFIELVRDGWIGSSGSATEQIQDLVRESISTGHSVLLGVQTGA